MVAASTSIRMQDHNQASRQSYIDRRIQRENAVTPGMTKSFTPDLQRDLIHRAEGVMLWLKLAADQIFNACAQGKSTRQLEAIMDAFPLELEDLYGRILDGFSQVQKAQN